jgi:hypothetical protein
MEEIWERWTVLLSRARKLDCSLSGNSGDRLINLGKFFFDFPHEKFLTNKKHIRKFSLFDGIQARSFSLSERLLYTN